MSTKRVGFVHTTPATIGMAEVFMKAYLPGVEFIHMYDGNVKLANFASPIGLTPTINLLRYAVFADELERAGVDCILNESYTVRDDGGKNQGAVLVCAGALCWRGGF